MLKGFGAFPSAFSKLSSSLKLKLVERKVLRKRKRKRKRMERCKEKGFCYLLTTTIKVISGDFSEHQEFLGYLSSTMCYSSPCSSPKPT